jgi:hypothetical protein
MKWLSFLALFLSFSSYAQDSDQGTKCLVTQRCVEMVIPCNSYESGVNSDGDSWHTGIIHYRVNKKNVCFTRNEKVELWEQGETTARETSIRYTDSARAISHCKRELAPMIAKMYPACTGQ